MAIKEICDIILADKSLEPKDDKTFCNIAVARICGCVGYNHFLGKMANDIIDFCEANWRLADDKEAFKATMQDNIVIAGQKGEKHGHVAVLYPQRMEYSPSWKKNVPMICNIGKKNGILRVSQAFHDEPSYYIMPTWGKRA